MYRVIGFGEVDQAHGHSVASFFLARSCRRCAAKMMSTVERWGKKNSLILRQDAFLNEVVAEAACDDFEEYFAGVCHEGYATATTRHCPIFLLCVQYLDHCVLPLWRNAPFPNTAT